MISKLYYLMGEVEEYLFGIGKFTGSKDHIAYPFSMEHNRNELSEYTKDFVTKLTFKVTEAI